MKKRSTERGMVNKKRRRRISEMEWNETESKKKPNRKDESI